MLKTLMRGALFLIMVGAFAVSDLSAQETPPPEQVELTDEVLENFAVVYLELDEIRKGMETELQLVQSPEQAQEIQQKANSKMMAMLDEHGFSQEEYAMIVAALNDDEEARDRFAEIIEELQEDTDG